MTDTMTETRPTIEARGDAPSAAPTPAAPKPRLSTEIANGAVTMLADGVPTASYAMADIPVTSHQVLALIGLRYLLVTAGDAKGAFAELVLGKVPGRTPAKPKALDNRRKAVALAWADEAAKAASEADKSWKKFLPGGKPSVDFAVMLENAEQRAAGAERATIAAEHKKAAVMKKYADLVGE